MGKQNYDQRIQHFSHGHPLELINIHTQPLNLVPCSGCKLIPSGWIYACRPCNYILDVSCSQMPQLIKHPAHPNHALSLLPRPAYPNGLFKCDACMEDGNGFCYRCNACGVDFHILCTTKPLSLTHHTHPHALNLKFPGPNPAEVFSCDICRLLGTNIWRYRCNGCDFDAHVNCATSKPTTAASAAVQNILQMSQQQQRQIPLQHANSFPMTTNPHQFKRTQTTGHMGYMNQQQPNYFVQPNSQRGSSLQSFPMMANPHQFVGTQTTGHMGYMNQQQPNYFVQPSSQRSSSLKGLVDLGQNLMKGLTGGANIGGIGGGDASNVLNLFQSMGGGGGVGAFGGGDSSSALNMFQGGGDSSSVLDMFSAFSG